MRLSNLTRQATHQVLCFVVAVSVLGTAPGIAHAETRAECIARVTQKFNDDVAVCARKRTSDEIDCDDERADEYHAAVLEYFNALLAIEADYQTHRARCTSDEVGELQECDATQLMCHQTNYNIYMMANIACYLSPNPPLCQMLNYALFMNSESLCDSTRATCAMDARQRRNDCNADADRIKQDRKNVASQTRAGQELAAQILYGVCIAKSWTDYIACVLMAEIAEQAGLLACPTDGHGAHDAPPPGHDAPPPPSGHDAPPSGHGAPPPG